MSFIKLKPLFFVIVLAIIFFSASCRKATFLNEMNGKWKVAEINYLFDSFTMTDYPPNIYFEFTQTNYTNEENGNVVETGTYVVNAKVTQLTFTSANGHNIMIIEEQSESFQHWRTKNKIGSFYLDFKLDKVE